MPNKPDWKTIFMAGKVAHLTQWSQTFSSLKWRTVSPPMIHAHFTHQEEAKAAHGKCFFFNRNIFGRAWAPLKTKSLWNHGLPKKKKKIHKRQKVCCNTGKTGEKRPTMSLYGKGILCTTATLRSPCPKSQWFAITEILPTDTIQSKEPMLNNLNQISYQTLTKALVTK